MTNALRRRGRGGKTIVAGILALAAAVAVGCHWQPPIRKTLPGALPFDPEANPDRTRAHKASRRFGWANGHPGRWTGDLDCHETSDCNGVPFVRFQITAEENARTTPMRDALLGSDPERGGYIVAQLINLDKDHEYRYLGMTAGDTAYLWVGPTKEGRKRFAIYRIPKTGAPVRLSHARASRWCRIGTQGVTDVHVPPEKPCSNPSIIYRSATGAKADEALGILGRVLRLASASPVMPSSMTRMFHVDGLWVSCSGGCCEASDWALQ